MDNFVDISGIESSFTKGNPEGITGYVLPEVTITGDKPEAKTGKLGQYATPENIAIAAQLAAGAFNALGKSEQQKLIKSACGRRPLIGKQKKATYEQCVANLMGAGRESSSTPSPPPGMDKTTKIIIFSAIGMVVLGLIIFLVVKLKKK